MDEKAMLNLLSEGIKQAKRVDRVGNVVGALWKIAFFLLGVTFLGVSVCSGFEPMKAFAGCAIVFTAKAL
jgi:hypothetical protein